MKQVIATPTFAGTILGFLALALWLAWSVPYTDIAAVVLLGSVGVGGSGIALWCEVKRDQQVWGWVGLWRALRRPSLWLWGGLLGHLFQALAALAIVIFWRRLHG